MFNTIKSVMLIEDLVLSSFNLSTPVQFSNKKIIYFYPNDTRNDLSGSPLWSSIDYNGNSPAIF